MRGEETRGRVIIVASLIILISVLHYVTGQGMLYYHLFYRDLYYLPLILAGFWFGVRGALLASLSITALFAPFIILTWQQDPVLDFDRILEVLLLNVVGIVLGILSDRENASHKQLEETSNLVAMGKAIAGVAHDIKTPLISIGGFIRLVRKHLSPESPDREKLELAVKETERLESLVKEMLDFSRPLALTIARNDVRTIVQSIAPLLQDQAKRRGVSIDTAVGSISISIECDENRMRQALLNLVGNAVEASPEGGQVRIRTTQERGRAIIDVVDEGPGIPAEIMDRIFIPFFTTKSGGTGLGLAIVAKIAQAHRGRVLGLKNPGRGMTFRLILPVRQAKTRQRDEDAE